MTYDADRRTSTFEQDIFLIDDPGHRVNNTAAQGLRFSDEAWMNARKSRGLVWVSQPKGSGKKIAMQGCL